MIDVGADPTCGLLRAAANLPGGGGPRADIVRLPNRILAPP
ncbi:MAG TPA: hypothetical protein VF586_10785 [Pyrinomonadaceae bacterium]